MQNSRATDLDGDGRVDRIMTLDQDGQVTRVVAAPEPGSDPEKTVVIAIDAVPYEVFVKVRLLEAMSGGKLLDELETDRHEVKKEG